jgi:hypothetical protein
MAGSFRDCDSLAKWGAPSACPREGAATSADSDTDLAHGFGAGITARPERGPAEKDMLATIGLEKLLAVERETVEKG